MRTRSQTYAALIYAQVSGVPKAEGQKYGTMAFKLPVLVRTAGLAQALAFVESRGSAEQQKLLQHLGAAVGVPNLAERSRNADLGEYMLLTRNVMAALDWYKRYAQSILGVTGDGLTEGDGAR